MTATLDWAEAAARRFEKPVRKWSSPGDLARHVDPLTVQTPALDLIDAVAQNILDGATRQQMVFAPPQTGKSQRLSRWTPLWFLTCDRSLRIAIVSYSDELAVRWGRQIKRDVEDNPDLGITLIGDSKAAGRWETTDNGSIYCVGISGSLTGQPVDVLVIDDPVKDRAAAESETMRDNVWDFWENVAKVRARKTILVQTRWHADDLAGRMIEREPDDWTVLSLPAIADSPDDALGREVGEEIESANRALHHTGYYTKMKATTSPYVWSSLYQQHPTLAEGNLFKRGDWRYWEQVGDELLIDGHNYPLADCTRFITMDLATSVKTSADYTVAAAWAITIDGKLVLLDRARERVPQTDHFELVAPLRQRWLGQYDVTWIESRMFGSTLVYALGRKGLPIDELKADADKLTRALAAADLVRQHRVHLPKREWLDEWLDEHAEFPNTRHDDQVDVMAYAARVALTHWAPMASAAEVDRIRSGPAELDFMSIAY